LAPAPGPARGRGASGGEPPRHREGYSSHAATAGFSVVLGRAGCGSSSDQALTSSRHLGCRMRGGRPDREMDQVVRGQDPERGANDAPPPPRLAGDRAHHRGERLTTGLLLLGIPPRSLCGHARSPSAAKPIRIGTRRAWEGSYPRSAKTPSGSLTTSGLASGTRATGSGRWKRSALGRHSRPATSGTTSTRRSRRRTSIGLGRLQRQSRTTSTSTSPTPTPTRSPRRSP